MTQQEEDSNRSVYSAILLENQELLISSFVEILRSRMPSAKSIDDKTLENSLREFISTVAQVLSLEAASDDLEIFKQNIQASREHGRSRAQLEKYTLDQVIAEFRILRSLIFHLLEQDGPLPPIERDKIFFAIDNGMIQAATEFAYHRGFKDARLTEEISEKKLAQDLAAELKNEQKQREKFISTITHDMRNPLSIARASAELLSRRALDHVTVQKYASKILTSIDRSNQMIKDLLDSNRLKSGGKLSLHREDCDLSTLIKDVCDDLNDVYGTRFRIDPLPSVRGRFDSNGMKRALENLMVNAIKYGAKDKPISISLKISQREVCIQVHNEGNPIPLKDQASLFDPYYRTETARKGKQQGWGIGLTLVKGIAEAHEGKVKVSSSKDAGTTFSIILPYSSENHKIAS